MIIFKISTNKHLNNNHVYKREIKYMHGRAGQALVLLKLNPLKSN